MNYSEPFANKQLEECTPDECAQKLCWSFAKEALADGLDTTMRTKTWEEAGRKLFPRYFDQHIGAHVVQALRELTDVGVVYTVSELAQLLTFTTPTDFNSAVRKVQIERAVDGAAGWLRTSPRVCPLLGIEVRQVWRRTA